jgi:hypothetical protein
MSASAAYAYPVQTLLTDENSFDLHGIGRVLSPIKHCAVNIQAIFKQIRNISFIGHEHATIWLLFLHTDQGHSFSPE